MEEIENSGARLIRLSEDAVYDLASIDNATATTWGETQADRYLGFLQEVFSYLSQEPLLGSPVVDRPNIFVFIAKYRPRRSAHGHRIFYREVTGGIEVLRVLHTAMNWPDHLGD